MGELDDETLLVVQFRCYRKREAVAAVGDLRCSSSLELVSVENYVVFHNCIVILNVRYAGRVDREHY